MQDKAYTITSQAFNQFVFYNKANIEEMIIKSIVNNKVVFLKENSVYFVFRSNLYYVVMVNKEMEIVNISYFEYEQLISMEFLNLFHSIYNKLPYRLQRWVRSNHMNVLRDEIIEAFILNKINIYNLSEDIIVCRWLCYELEFLFSDDLRLKQII